MQRYVEASWKGWEDERASINFGAFFYTMLNIDEIKGRWIDHLGELIELMFSVGWLTAILLLFTLEVMVGITIGHYLYVWLNFEEVIQFDLRTSFQSFFFVQEFFSILNGIICIFRK